MAPLGAISSVRAVSGPVMIQRYNMYASAAVNGAPAPGVSSGQAIASMESVAREGLRSRPAMQTDWTELALLQLQTGNTAMCVFVLAVVLVFLVLAAQYESWSLPLAVILVVPMCLLCSIAGVLVARLDVNVFTQVGFVVLVGFGVQERHSHRRIRQGPAGGRRRPRRGHHGRLPAAAAADHHDLAGLHFRRRAADRFRGRRAEMRRTLGMAVFSGMLGVTLFGIFLTPVFYYVIDWAGSLWKRP